MGANTTEISPDSQPHAIRVVGIGASAGGLKAIEGVFSSLPIDTNVAFVLVTHLDPGHATMLPALLRAYTPMPVCQLTGNTLLQANQVYVAPASEFVSIAGGLLTLSPFSDARGTNRPIDFFLESLASDQKSDAIGIILSGTGSDGSEGAKAIRKQHGLVVVQDDSAQFDSMPINANRSGLADHILAPSHMARALIDHISDRGQPSQPANLGPATNAALDQVYAILRSRTGQDFSAYKKSTVHRRIERRMESQRIDTVDEYVRYLSQSQHEPDTLVKELLIGVTSFFRNSGSFAALRQAFIQFMKTEKRDNVRVWVPACSSGEEAYSIAITLQECMQEIGTPFHVQIFATDIDQDAIDIARSGLYSKKATSGLSVSQLEQWFTKEEDGRYRIDKHIREMLVFALQNVISDPPFTNLDILSCRNLLIYFETELQRKLMAMFHYSLVANGLLFLGSSETVGSNSELFEGLDKKKKLYRRLPTTSDSAYRFPMLHSSSQLSSRDFVKQPVIQGAEEQSAIQLAETILRQSDVPACVVTDDAGNIVYVHGRTGRFLELAEGRADLNLLRIARPGIRLELTKALREAATSRVNVVRRNITVTFAAVKESVDISVKRITAQPEMFLVTFDDSLPAAGEQILADLTTSTANDEERAAKLERELLNTKETLQTTIEEMEAANEELKSANEELQSTNEELQSSNEELETSKEELQSLNEESSTVNAELQARIEDLDQANDDLRNLLDSTEIAVVFLDLRLRIQRFTPRATDIFPLTTSDTGRLLSDLSSKLINTDLTALGEAVLSDLGVREIQAACKDGSTYITRLRPYRTSNNVIKGVVVTFQGVSGHAADEHHMAALFSSMSGSVSGALALVEHDSGRILEATKTAYEQLHYTRREFLELTVSQIEVTETLVVDAKADQDTGHRQNKTFATQLRDKTGDARAARVTTTMWGRQHLLYGWELLAP